METPELIRFVDYAKHGGIYHNYEGMSYAFLRSVGSKIRLISLFGVFVACVYGNSVAGLESFLNGNILYVPIACLTAMHPLLAYFNQDKFEILVLNLDRVIASYTEEKDRIMLKEYYDKVWRAVMIYNKFYLSVPVLYFGVTLVQDTYMVVTEGSDHPYTLPMPLSGFIGKNATRDAQFYCIMVISSWYAVEIVRTQHYWIASFLITIVYSYATMKILRRRILESPLQLKYDKQSFNQLVDEHNNIIRLCRCADAYLGSQGAFQNLYASINMTLAVFCVFKTSSAAIMFAYTFSFTFYVTANYIYSSMGQLIESEGEDILLAIVSLPWYDYAPKERANMRLMIMYAEKKLGIDFHGLSPMNLSTFLQIVQTSMSYFTILQSITS